MLNLTQEPLSLKMCIDNDRDTKLADFISDDSYDADPSYAYYMKEFRYHYNKMDGRYQRKRTPDHKYAIWV